MKLIITSSSSSLLLLSLLLVVIVVVDHKVNAFVPQQKLIDLQGSFESVIQRAADDTHSLWSSRAEPMVSTTTTTAAASSSNSNTKNNKKKTRVAIHKMNDKMATSLVSAKHAIAHKRWGIDNTWEEEYWSDPRIHTLGNSGFMGAVHAALAPISTKMIDNLAYDGVDIRKKVAEELSTKYKKEKAKVLDLCCGVGFSTRALTKAFPDAEQIVGIDTSNEMLAMANFITAHVSHLKPWYDKMITQGRKQIHICSTSFKKGNAENTPFKDGSFDVVTIMYAFHEAPKQGRERILKEVRRLLSPGGVLAVIDISTDYTPSKSMLAGEPYVLEYQKTIHSQLGNQRGFSRASYKNLVPGHVGMWVLKRSAI